MSDEKPKNNEQANTPSQAGLVCPRCGCTRFHVLSTRRAPGGRIIRRRECHHCGRRVTTVERVV